VLTIVPTPLGNLDDITLRCLSALKSADVIFAEDTRRTLILARHYGLNARIERYNEHDDKSVAYAHNVLLSGKNAALVSDCGTPCVSDPGWKLVAAARASNIKVESLPGPCAATTAIAGSGFPSGPFVFLGFLPRKRSRVIKALTAAATLNSTMVVYESPFRIVKLLGLAAEALGPDTQAAIARELTKVHEEWLTGTLTSIGAELAKRDKVLGEFVLLINPRKPEEPDEDDDTED